MLALDVRLRFGVYDAGASRVPTSAEWPPEPSRVFCALVAGGPTDDEWAALRWLEQQPAPEVHCSSTYGETAPEMFVITNETKASSPLRPGRKADKRIKPSSYPQQPRFAIVWPESTAEPATFAALTQLARRVPYIGRSSAQATVDVRAELDDAEPAWRQYRPVDIGQGLVDLGVPYPGYCDGLQDEYESGGRAWEVRRSVEYGTGGRLVAKVEAPPVFGPLSKLLVLDGDLGGWSVSQTATITDALRSAVMSRVADPLPDQLGGHVEGVQHVGFLTLPNVGSPARLDAAPKGSIVRPRNLNADGRVMGLALTIPVDMEEADVSKIVKAVTGADDAGEGWILNLPRSSRGGWQVRVQRQQGAPRHWATSPDRWCRPSKIWATATPLVFDQYPSGRSEEMMVAQALIAAGYPPPVRVATQRAPILPGAASHTVSSVMRRASQRTRPFTHAWVAFDVDVVGPVMAGSMRYRGLGLFAPIDGVIADETADEVADAADIH